MWNVFRNCIDLLLNTLLGRESDTVPPGYGIYFRLEISLIDPLGGVKKYSSTRIWNVFQFTVFISYWKTPLRRESNIVPHGYEMYFLLK